jgi:hypothetical protein
MSNASPARDLSADRASEPLFKRDHPRHIDTYIDFFGGDSSAATDPCGEALLDALAADESEE